MVFDGSDFSFFWSGGPETGSIYFSFGTFSALSCTFGSILNPICTYSILICSFWSAIDSTFDVSLGGGALASAYFDSEQTSQ